MKAKKQMRKHVQLHFKAQHVFTCFECKEKCLSQQSFEKHFKEVHKIFHQSGKIKYSKRTTRRFKNGNFICKDCPKAVFNNIYTLRIHRSRLHISKVLCKICNQKYPHGYDMSRHLLCHKNSQFICSFEDCLKVFRYRNLLRNHYLNFHFNTDPKEICDEGENEALEVASITTHQIEQNTFAESITAESCSLKQKR